MKFFKTQLVKLTHNTTKTQMILRLTTDQWDTDLKEMWQFQWLWYKLWHKFRFEYLDFYPRNFNKYEYQRTKNYDIFKIEIFKKVS